MAHLDECRVLASLFEARPDRGLDVGAAEGRQLPEDPWDLNAVVEEKAEFPLGGTTLLIGNQSKHIYDKRKQCIQVNIFCMCAHICKFWWCIFNIYLYTHVALFTR